MASSGLHGPYSLTTNTIDTVVKSTSPGAYALGKSRDNTFYISYVGRSDVNVNNRLRDHVGDYDQFKYAYFSSEKAAFEKECRLYHDIEPPGNDVHPARPRGKNWKCPVCTIFDKR